MEIAKLQLNSHIAVALCYAPGYIDGDSYYLNHKPRLLSINETATTLAWALGEREKHKESLARKASDVTTAVAVSP